MMNSEAFEKTLLKVTSDIEKQVDETIEQIDNLDVSDLEKLRKQRIKELKAQEGKKQEWVQNGHGNYEQLAEEKMFFDVIKKSENVIVHFFTATNTRSPIVDKHLKILAPKHLETKFVSLNAEKCPFLAEKLRIKVIPTIICIHNGIMVDKIVGFTSLGNRDDFTTPILEWRLAQNKAINYDGDLSVSPDQQQEQESKQKHSIRDGIFNNQVDDDLELEDYSNRFEDKIDGVFSNIKSNQNYLTPEEERELGIENE